jgi:hypothetical protein
MLRKRPIPALGNNSASDNPVSEIKESKIKSFVHNPKGKDNKEAVYTSCDYLTVKASDYANMNGGTVIEGSDADYWALVAICALENGTAQGRCDVAQSIYNRLASGKYTGSSIKALIVAKNQYEPVSRAVSEFNAVNSKATAIKAVQKSKNYDVTQATNAIDNTIDALKNTTLIQSSASWVGGRTDFYSETIKDQIPSNGIGLKTRDGQVFGWFVGPGSIAYGNTSPGPASFTASA